MNLSGGGIDRNLITIILGTSLVLCLVGAFVLILASKTVPDQVWNLAFALGSGLVGALLPRQSTPEDNPPPLEQPEPA